MSARRSGRRGSRTAAGTGSNSRKRCLVDGVKLRALRQDAELSIRQLAYSVGVDPKTITDLEAGGRRTWTQVRVVRSIAAHPEINVDWTDLLVGESKPNERPAAPAAPLLPPRSSLDVFVSEERRAGKLASAAHCARPGSVLRRRGVGQGLLVAGQPGRCALLCSRAHPYSSRSQCHRWPGARHTVSRRLPVRAGAHHRHACQAPVGHGRDHHDRPHPPVSAGVG